MANGIAVTPERLREVSAQVGAGAAEVDAILSRLTTAVAPIRSEWVGAAQVQFEALWNQLQQDASGVQAVLSGIAKLTQNAATAYAATEQSIANSFNENFRRDGRDFREVESSPTDSDLTRSRT